MVEGVVVRVVLFLVFLGDAVLSFWVPNFIQDSLGSSFAMGLVLSFSSIIGFATDLIFPQILRGITVKKLVTFGILASLVFSLLLIKATFTPLLMFFLLAMAVWGIYYELLGFGEQQFVADSIPLRLHSSAWGVLSVFKSMAYFVGPLLAGLFLVRGEMTPLFLALIFAGLGLFILLLTKNRHKRNLEIEVHEVSLLRELEHWETLLVRVWPVVTLSSFMGLIDATFWTTGAVWSETLSKQSFLGGFFLPLYVLPSTFMGFVVAKWGIYRGKKKKAMKFLLASGIFLSLLGIGSSIVWQLFCVFVSSILLSISYPLTDAVYSDIVARMGRERKHLIGLSRSTMSVAYIVGPAVAGFIASQVGERMTFSIVGISVVIVSFVLLLTTPKKLLLPQEEITNWKD